MKQRNFKEIYDNIYQNCGPEIEKKRKETLKKDILAFAIAVVVWVLILASGLSRLIFVFIILFIITIIALSIAIVKINKQYKKMFKENVINEIVKQSNPSFVYSDNKGIRETEYSESKFDFGWDRYHSEDMIEGKLEDGSLLKMSQVHTEEEHETTDSKLYLLRSHQLLKLDFHHIPNLPIYQKSIYLQMQYTNFASHLHLLQLMLTCSSV